MQLNVGEVAALFNVTENTVYHWIKKNRMPTFKVKDQYRFSRVDILEWATSQGINVSSNFFESECENDTAAPCLAGAIQNGGIFRDVAGTDVKSVLKTAVELVPLPPEVDKSFLLHVLMARESLGSTGIGNGIAIPHVRNPIVMFVPQPIITLCFLKKPIDFSAIDGKLVHTVFMLISPTVSTHLHMQARLSLALRNSAFLKVILDREANEKIVEAAKVMDKSFCDASGAGRKKDRRK